MHADEAWGDPESSRPGGVPGQHGSKTGPFARWFWSRRFECSAEVFEPTICGQRRASMVNCCLAGVCSMVVTSKTIQVTCRRGVAKRARPGSREKWEVR